MVKTLLPSYFKDRLNSIEVKVTQTSAEDLWKHFCDVVNDRYEEKVCAVFRRLEDKLNELQRENPYLRYDVKQWRQKRVRRHFDRMNSPVYNLYDLEKSMYFMEIKTDFAVCCRNKDLLWGDDPTKAEQIKAMEQILYRADRYFQMSRELEELDDMLYNEAHRQWRETDAEWLNEQERLQKVKAEHHSHKTPEQWKTYYTECCKLNGGKKDEMFFSYYGIPEDFVTIPSSKLLQADCELCIKEERARMEQEEANRKYEEEVEQQNRLWRMKQEEEERRRKTEEEERRKKEKPLTEYTCKDCDVTIKGEHNWKLHLTTKEHKHAKLYCKVCQHTSRCESEHTAHMESKKHLLRVEHPTGDIPAKVYTCEACQYHTTFLSAFHNHKKSKKHQDRVLTLAQQ